MELACPSQKETHKTRGIYAYQRRDIANIKKKKPSRAGGTRTHKTSRPEDFKSSASA